MKEQHKDNLAKVAVAGSYLSLAVLAVWRGMRGKRLADKPHAAHSLAGSLLAGEDYLAAADDCAGDVTPTQPQLQDLSLRTPGAAELDRIARIAAAEQQQEAIGIDIFAEIPPFSQPPSAAIHDAITRVLEHQALDDKRLAGWSRPRPDTLPVPTFAPAIMAFGIVMFAMGLATTWYVCLIGSVIFAIAAWRWTGELQGG
jgi:hypothetical protein